MKYKNGSLTRGEQSILGLLKDFSPMKGTEIAAALGSNAQSVRVMIWKMRERGVIIYGELGPKSKGYSLAREQ